MPGDPAPARIAMWSGPRNVSTALMRAWENRPDTVVYDEPLYAHYLRETGLDHPGREEVLAAQDTDWRRVAVMLTGPLPVGVGVFYQKHMAHHLLPCVGRDWLAGLRHAFLIRDPAEMLASYARVRDTPTLEDTGLPQQVEIRRSYAGPVVDARDLLLAPGPVLRALCAELAVPFDERMLGWPAGPRSTDGVWAPYWYDGVRASTGFAAYRPPTEPFPPRLAPLLQRCRPYYDELHALRITG